MLIGDYYKGVKYFREESRECQGRMCNFRDGLFEVRNESYCGWRGERERDYGGR